LPMCATPAESHVPLSCAVMYVAFRSKALALPRAQTMRRRGPSAPFGECRAVRVTGRDNKKMCALGRHFPSCGCYDHGRRPRCVLGDWLHVQVCVHA